MWYKKQCPKCYGDMYEEGEEVTCLQCGLRIDRRIFECGSYQQLWSMIEKELKSSSEKDMSPSLSLRI